MTGRLPRTRRGPSVRLAPLATVLLIVSGCTSGDSDAEAWTPPWPATDSALVRTAVPAVRGYTEDDFPRVLEVAPGVFTYEQLRSAGDERFTTVSMFVVTEEGVLVADGQGSLEETERLVEHIRAVTDEPITHVVVCSDHGDHTAGNAAFPAGATFYAHPRSVEALRARADDPERPALATPVVVPTETVDSLRVLELGGREIRILHLGRAHTGGDLVVHLPEERIVFMSEAYLNRIFPAMRSAYPLEWVQMIARAQLLGADLFVPGHGFVDPPEVSREELLTFRRAIERMVSRVAWFHSRGHTVEEAMEQVDFVDIESWALRDSQRETAVRRIWAELSGELR